MAASDGMIVSDSSENAKRGVDDCHSQTGDKRWGYES